MGYCYPFKQAMIVRPVLRGSIIFVLCLAVFTTSAVGIGNGVVIHVDDHGHHALIDPHIHHAAARADGVDHAPADFGDSADHENLHDVMKRTLKARPASILRKDAGLEPALYWFHIGHTLSTSQIALSDLTVIPTPRWNNDWPGSAARTELTCLQATVLLL
jgi:hypothetical protein